jgi:hypothetical protein
VATFLPDATLEQRARSLARSYLRLVRGLERSGLAPELDGPDAQAELLARTSLLVQLQDLLDATARLSAPLQTELDLLFDEQASALPRLQQEVFAPLSPAQRSQVRTRMLQHAIGTTELEAFLAEVLEAAASGKRSGTPVHATRAPAHRSQWPGREELLTIFGELQQAEESDPAAGTPAADPDDRQLLDLFPPQAFLEPEEVLQELERDWRRVQEDRPLPLGSSLRTLLDKQPAHWVEAIHGRLGLPPARNKRDRSQAIAQRLADPAGLRHVLGTLGREETAGLAHLLARGGWQRLGHFARRFGSDAQDGWFWVDDPPRSVLGQLRLHGLVFVGRALIDGRRCKVALIPPEIRPPLVVLLPPPTPAGGKGNQQN